LYNQRATTRQLQKFVRVAASHKVMKSPDLRHCQRSAPEAVCVGDKQKEFCYEID